MTPADSPAPNAPLDGLLDGDPAATLDTATYRQVVGRLEQFMGAKRLEHVKRVAESAVELARLHAPQLTRRAQLAGLLHDNAKKLTDEQLLGQAARFGIEPTPAQRQSPQLLHGAVGAALLPERFGLDDSAIAQAVADHVTGRAGMGQLSRILYVADQIESGRDFPGVDELRELARRSLDETVGQVARKKIEYVLLKGQMLDPQTSEVWNAFRPCGA